MKLTNRIAFLRKAAGISQTQLAERIGATLSMVGKLERGERDLNEGWISKISEALGCPPASLFEQDKPIREFGNVEPDGTIFNWGPEQIGDSFTGLGRLTGRVDEFEESDGVQVPAQWDRSVTASSAINMLLPEGSRFIFRWSDAPDGPTAGELHVIGFWMGDRYRVVLGQPFPGSSATRHHVLPVGGTMITDVDIEVAAKVTGILIP